MDLLVLDAPGPIGIAAGGAGRGLRAAFHIDGLGEVAAIAVAARHRVGRRDRSVIAGIRIAPGGGRPGGCGFQRALRRLLGIGLVGPVQRRADLTAGPGAQQGADAGRDQLAGAAAELRAEKAAGDGAADGAEGLLVARALGAAGQDEGRENGWNEGFSVHIWCLLEHGKLLCGAADTHNRPNRSVMRWIFPRANLLYAPR